MALFMIAVHAAAVGVVAALPCPWWAVLLFGILILTSLLYHFYHYVLMADANAIVRLVNHGDGRWHLMARDGRSFTAQLAGDSCVHPWGVVLNFDLSPHGRRSMVLLPDALPAAEFRHLRVRLRTQSRGQAV